MARVGYLGPEGSFASLALARVRSLSVEEAVPLASVGEVVAAVERGDLDAGVVPAESSVEGIVNATVDALVRETTATLVREEVSVPVTFTAWAPPGAGQALREVVSHPHAIAQCRRFAEGLELTPAASTAAACEEVARRRAPGVVALAGPTAGERYGLVPVATGVEDRPGARTSFFLLARTLAPAAAEASARTFLVVAPSANRPGVLVEVLRAFSARGLDLTSVASRPLGAGPFRYCFLLQVRARREDAELRSALEELGELGHHVKFLGTFEADGEWEGTGGGGGLPPGFWSRDAPRRPWWLDG